MTNLAFAIEPVWRQTQPVRQKMSEFLEPLSVDTEVAYSVGMVAAELVENAVKYGAYSEGETLSLVVTARERHITVEVSHRIDDAALPHLERLDTMVQWIRGFQDPFEAYLARLENVSQEALDLPESGLGLVRIAYEGHCLLDFFVNEHNQLAVSAVYPLEGGRS